MSLISATIPNLVNGISQQPPTARLASQAELQLNALSSVSTGLSKRPPSHHVARLSATPLDGAFVHTINRDATEQYEVIISDGDLQVWDINGSPRSVTFPNGKGYLASSDPSADFRAVSVLDHTFIVNRTVTVEALQDVTTQGAPYEALLWVRQGAYASTYTVTVDGVVTEWKTLDASQPANAVFVATDHIMANLHAQIVANLAAAGVSGIFTAIYGSTVRLTSFRQFTVTVSDSLGDGALKLIKGSVQSFSDLPAKAMDNFRVRVQGTNDNSFDDYYVTYAAAADNPNGGVWRECPKTGEQFRLNRGTMPYTLKRLADGTFSFEQAPYDERTVGDLESVPFPSFVGQRINDVLFHRNRLGFTSGENVVLSRAGGYFNFFRETALQVLDTDPIDVAVATGGGAAVLNHAVAFNEGLLLFSDQAQFQFGKADLLTPKTASITLTTQFGCSRTARPVGAGKTVFFTYPRGSFSAVREYYLDGDTRTNDAADITAHCPSYLPADIRALVASPNEDILAASSRTEPNAVYVYRWYWQGTTKLQSAWSKWTLQPGDRVIAMEWIRSTLFLVISRDSGTYLEKMFFDVGRADTGVPFEFLLDRRTTVFPTHAGGKSYITLPYAVTDPDAFRLIAGATGGTYRLGQAIPFKLTSPTTIEAAGTAPVCIFGAAYVMRYRFSQLLLREEASGGGQQPVTGGRFQVRRMSLQYAASGYFRAEVTPTARDTYTYTFSGRVLGSARNVLGSVAIETGTFNFAVASKNDEVAVDVVNDSHLPSVFLSAGWEAFYAARSRRV